MPFTLIDNPTFLWLRNAILTCLHWDGNGMATFLNQAEIYFRVAVNI